MCTSYFVFPPVVVLKQNEELKITNATDEDLDWSVDQNALDPKSGKVGKKQKDKAGKARAQGKAKFTTYPYTVEMTLPNGNKQKAKAHSDPVLIIEM